MTGRGSNNVKIGLGRIVRTLLGALILGFSAELSAIGLGRLVVDSDLNEPFSAEILISSIGEVGVKNLKVGLASKSDFERAGIVVDPVLNRLTFAIVEGKESLSIRVLSEEPIRTPFLHFMVAIEWPGGKLIREYTALLDPPGYEPTAVQPIQRPETTGDQRVLRPGETYGPVRSGETLMGIAGDIETVKATSIYQRMFALIHANPEAFIRGNMNLLREGASLKIPSTKSMSRISSVLAKEEYSRQLSEWIAYHDNVGENKSGPSQPLWASFVGGEKEDQTDPSAQAQEGSGKDEKPDKSLTGAPVSESKRSIGIDETEKKAVTGLPKATDTGQYVLRIIQPEPESEEPKMAAVISDVDASQDQDDIAALDQALGAMEEKLTLLEESLASKELENEKLSRQITLLTEQVEKSAHLIALQDEALALAQQQAENRTSETTPDSSGTSSGADQTASDSTELVTTKTEDVTKEESTAASVGTVAKVPVADQPVVATMDSDSDTEKEAGGSAGTEDKVSQPADAVAPPKDVGKQTVAATVEKKKDWWELDSLIELPINGYSYLVSYGYLPQERADRMILFGGGGLVLLLGLLFLRLRRRRTDDEDFDDDFDNELEEASADEAVPASVETPEVETPKTVAEPSGPVVLPEPEEEIEAVPAMSIGSGFVTEAETAQGISVQSDEVDPIAESEIYLAYGRNDQAEQVLTDAIRGAPDRLELKIKLLEVFQAQGNVDGFTSMAELLATQIDHGSSEWAQIVRMARQVAPDNATLQDDNIGESSDEALEGAGALDQPQEISLDALTGSSDESSEEEFVASEQIEEITPESFSSDEIEATQDTAAADIEFDLSELEPTTEAQPAEPEDAEKSPAEEAFDDGIDFILEPEGELSSQVPDSRTDPADEVTEMEDLEQDSDSDIGTRLDLARAYIEMGDTAAARALLDEVKQLGTTAQKEEAESLIAGLSTDDG